MIQVIKYKAINKNTLQAMIDIKVPKWGNFIIRDISYFKRSDQRWVSMPSRQYEKDGEKKYYSYNMFEDLATMKQFQEKIMEALDEYVLKENM